VKLIRARVELIVTHCYQEMGLECLVFMWTADKVDVVQTID